MCMLRIFSICFLAISFFGLAYAQDRFGVASVRSDSPYDIVLVGGRVMDPETGLDAIRNIAITDGTISRISTDRNGQEMIDVTGQIVAPGFIDVHNHSPTPLGQIYQARDGVTTTLELEAGSYPVAVHGSYIRRQARLNYGASIGHIQARMAALSGRNPAGVQDILSAKRTDIR